MSGGGLEDGELEDGEVHDQHAAEAEVRYRQLTCEGC